MKCWFVLNASGLVRTRPNLSAERPQTGLPCKFSARRITFPLSSPTLTLASKRERVRSLCRRPSPSPQTRARGGSLTTDTLPLAGTLTLAQMQAREGFLAADTLTLASSASAWGFLAAGTHPLAGTLTLASKRERMGFLTGDLTRQWHA
jgi:hypothetical protein